MLSLLAFASLLSAASAPDAHADNGRRVYHIVLSGMINEASALWVIEGIKEAIEGGGDLVVLELNTPGGTVQHSEELANFIFTLDDIEVIAYVNTRALSGGTMVALACDAIYMDASVGRIGNVAPVLPTGEMLPEKVQTEIRAIMANYGEQRGYPVALIEAMVTAEYAVYRIRFEDEETYMFVRDVVMETWSQEEKDRIASRELIVAGGDLLTVSASSAVEYGLAAGAVSSRLHLFDELGIDPGQVERIYLTWTQRLLTFLSALSPLLLVGGLILLYIELREPGLGVPGIIGIVCLGTFFLVQYTLQYAEMFEIILFAIGITLLLVELFIVPGFGFVGASGIFLIFVSLVLMLQQFRLPASPSEFKAFQFNLLEVTGVFLAVAFGLVLLARFLGKVPFMRKMIRTENLASATVFSGAGTAAMAGGAGMQEMVGAEGLTITQLHPSGKAEFDEMQYDVTAEGEYIEKGVRVEVIAVRGRRLAVRRS